MIKVAELQHQLLLRDDEIKMAMKHMLIKTNSDGEIKLSEARRLTDWAAGYTEASVFLDFEG